MLLDTLPYEILALVLSYLPLLDYYSVKLAGSRRLAYAVRSACSRLSKSEYLRALQTEDAQRKGLDGGRRRRLMEIMVERGQLTLVARFQRKYSSCPSCHSVSRFSISESEDVNLKEKRLFAMALPWAAYYGHEDVVRLLIGRVHLRSGRLRRTALHYAAANNQLGIVQILLGHGAYVNALDNNGQTPLAVALEKHASEVAEALRSRGGLTSLDEIMRGHHRDWMNLTAPRTSQERCLELVAAAERYLPRKVVRQTPRTRLYLRYLKAKAAGDVSQQPDILKEALGAAVISDDKDMVLFVLEEGADINAIHELHKGQTALHLATKRDNAAMAQLLLLRGADATTIAQGITPVQRALYRQQDATVRFYLDRGFSVDVQNSDGKTALHISALRGKESTVKYLLGLGANVDAPDNNDNTALHGVASQPGLRGEFRAMKLLVEAGANINALNNKGYTPLLSAMRSRGCDSLRTVTNYLLSQGASIDAQDAAGLTALHVAAGRGRGLTRANILELLVDHGAALDLQDKLGRTPLHMLLAHCDLFDSAKLLVERGANVNKRDKTGATPLHLALKREPVQISNSRHQHPRALEAEPRHCKLLLDHGADLNISDDQGLYPLHVAFYCIHPYKGHCKFLLESGADPNVLDLRGRTALHIVLHHQTMSPVDKLLLSRLLLKHGADVNARDKMGWTPLHYILHCCDRKNADKERLQSIVKVLLRYGADIYATDDRGYSVLDLGRAVGGAIDGLLEYEAGCFCLPLREVSDLSGLFSDWPDQLQTGWFSCLD